MRDKTNENVEAVTHTHTHTHGVILKNKKAITLIALVITIVVLIILAGVAINLTLGDNGIFNKAKYAKEEYLNAKEMETTTLAQYQEQLNNSLEGSRGTINDYRDNLIVEYKGINNINNNTILSDYGNLTGTLNGNGIEIKTDSDGRKYYHFSEYDEYISISNINGISGNTPKSISCMFRTNDSSSGYHGIICLGVLTSGGTGMAPAFNEGFFRFDTGSWTYYYEPRLQNVADNKWHFICVTYDEKNLVLYLDDRPVFATNATLNTTPNVLYIGNMPGAGFIGDISDVRVYGEGLNIEQVYAIYKNVKK